MKILYVANVRMPTEKAHGVQIMKTCEALAELGHEVTLFVPRRRNVLQQDPFLYYAVDKTFRIRRLWCIDSVEWGRAGFLLQSISFTFSALRHVRTSGGDVVYTRDPLVVALMPRRTRTIVAWEAHSASQAWSYRKAARDADLLLPVTQGLGRYYEPVREGKKILVLHDGVDLKDFADARTQEQLRVSLGLPLGRKIAAYIGKYRTLEASKGVEEIIESIVTLPVAERPCLMLVGLNAEEIPEVRERAAALGYADGDILLVGHAPHKDVAAYMRASDALIMAYPDTPHYRSYMSPLKLFEYMASGVPIVSTDLPSIREVLSDETAYLVPPGDTEALARSISVALHEPVASAQKASRARTEVEAYSWKRRAERISDGLSEISS